MNKQLAATRAALILLAAALPGALFAAGPVPPKAAPRSRPGTPARLAPSTAAVLSPELRALLAKAPSAKDFPNASKATLLDLADITVRPNGSSRTVTRQVVKVFNERGRDEGEVSIPYNSDYETLTIVRARTILPSGKVLTVKPADVRDASADGGDGSYSDARVKSFSLPAVNDGAVLEYEYVTDQKRPLLPGQFWTKWWFQTGTDPVSLSRLTVTLPKSLVSKNALKNTGTRVKPIIRPGKDGKTVTYTYQDVSVPAIEFEPMMPDADRVAPHLVVSTVNSWDDIAAWYYKLAKDRMKADATIKAQVASLTRGKTTPEEKAKAIFYYVEEKTRYVALEYGIGGYQPRPAADVCRNQYGDCKDMATLLVAMLREAGITAYPVLLRAGSTASVRDQLPNANAFNHAICLAEIGGKQYWLDATAGIATFGVTPGSDRGCDALVIRDGGKGQFQIIPPATPAENKMEQSVKLALAPDGSATGTVTVRGVGDPDLGLRAALRGTRPDKIKDLVGALARSLAPNAQVVRYDVSDFRNKDVPVTITADVQIPRWAQKTGTLLIFKARAEQGAGSGQSPFQTDKREHPIFQESAGMGAATIEVSLPAGYTILSAPESVDLSSDLGRFFRTVTSDANKLSVRVEVENRRADIPVSRYPEVRKYYGSLVEMADEPVVIKKG